MIEGKTINLVELILGKHFSVDVNGVVHLNPLYFYNPNMTWISHGKSWPRTGWYGVLEPGNTKFSALVGLDKGKAPRRHGVSSHVVNELKRWGIKDPVFGHLTGVLADRNSFPNETSYRKFLERIELEFMNEMFRLYKADLTAITDMTLPSTSVKPHAQVVRGYGRDPISPCYTLVYPGVPAYISQSGFSKEKRELIQVRRNIPGFDIDDLRKEMPFHQDGCITIIHYNNGEIKGRKIVDPDYVLAKSAAVKHAKSICSKYADATDYTSILTGYLKLRSFVNSTYGVNVKYRGERRKLVSLA